MEAIRALGKTEDGIAVSELTESCWRGLHLHPEVGPVLRLQAALEGSGRVFLFLGGYHTSAQTISNKAPVYRTLLISAVQEKKKKSSGSLPGHPQIIPVRSAATGRWLCCFDLLGSS